ncbi:MAG TPA: hypothetical protein VM510_02630, partial [Caulifigura sp.]|nr:hypothetical protein [Caulifigura sp.]
MNACSRAGRIVGAVVIVAAVAAADDRSGKSGAAIIKQESIGSMACAPCAVLNMAANGSEDLKRCAFALPGNAPEQRVQSLIEQYCSKPSVVYSDKRTRYTAKHGIAPEELADVVNDFLDSKADVQVAGSYLDRLKNEPAEKHLRRIWSLFRKSLDAGVPPIIEIRSFAARPSGSDFKWEGLMGHFVVVTELDPIGEGEKGFRFRFADS